MVCPYNILEGEWYTQCDN